LIFRQEIHCVRYNYTCTYIALSTTWYEHEQTSGIHRDVIHLRVLHHFVEAGDILLFRSSGRVSGAQRSVFYMHTLLIYP